MKYKKQISVFLSGGLGNQIFQLYAGIALSRIKGKEILVDMTLVPRTHSQFDITSFDIPFSIQNKKWLSRIHKRWTFFSKAIGWFRNHSKWHLVDQGIELNLKKANETRVIGLSGYFQNLNYFQSNKDFIIKLKSPSEDFLNLKKALEDYSYLSVHIRRGDFSAQSQSHGCLAAQWYISTIDEIIIIEKDLNLLVLFSDDKNWVVGNLMGKIKSRIEVLVISPSDLEDPAESWTLIREANHILCANSTFSISAAILSSARVTVPAPLTRSKNFEEITSSLPNHWRQVPAVWE